MSFDNSRVQKLMGQFNSSQQAPAKKQQPTKKEAHVNIPNLNDNSYTKTRQKSKLLKETFKTTNVDKLLKENHLVGETAEFKDNKMIYEFPSMTENSMVLLDTERLTLSLSLTTIARAKLTANLSKNSDYMRNLLDPTKKLVLVDKNPFETTNKKFEFESRTSSQLSKANVLRLLQIEKTLKTVNSSFIKTVNLMLSENFEIIE